MKVYTKRLNSIRKELSTFLILTFLLSSLFYYFISRGDLSESVAFGLMWCPGIAAIMTHLIYYRSIVGLGWKLCNVKYLGLALLLPLILCLLEFGIVCILVPGSVDFDFAKELFSTRKILWIVVNLFGNMVFALGEEIGWRGLLVQQLSKLTTFTKTAILSGLIWAIWHYPTIILSGSGESTPLWHSLPLFTIGLIFNGFIFVWFTLKTGSIWPAVILHGAGNFFSQSVFGHLIVDNEKTRLLSGEFGIIGGIILLIAAYVFWRMRRYLPVYQDN